MTDMLVERADEVVRDLGRALLTDLDMHACEVAERIHSQMPEFGRDASVSGLSIDAVRGVISRFASICVARTDVRQAPLSAEAVEYARAFARRGIELPLLIRTYRLGQAELRASMAKMMDRQGLPSDVAAAVRDALAERGSAYVDHITNELTAEYTAERRRWVKSSEARRARVVDSILSGERIDAEQATRTLGYPLNLEHVGAVLWTENAVTATTPETLPAHGRELARISGARTRFLLPAGQTVLWVWLAGLDELGGLEERVEGWCAAQDGLRLALGEPHRGVLGFAETHREATFARRFAQLDGAALRPVTPWAQVAVLGLLTADLSQAQAFADAELGALGGDHETIRQLRTTLLVFLQEGDVKHACERLNVHRNTVGYRLRQCEEILGRSVRERRFETEAALRLHSLLQPPSESNEPVAQPIAAPRA